MFSLSSFPFQFEETRSSMPGWGTDFRREGYEKGSGGEGEGEEGGMTECTVRAGVRTVFGKTEISRKPLKKSRKSSRQGRSR